MAILPYVLVAQEFWVNGTTLRSRDFSQISVPAIWIGVVVAVHGEQGDKVKGGREKVWRKMTVVCSNRS